MKTLKMFWIAVVLALVVGPPHASAQTICGAGVSGCSRTTLSVAQSAGAANNTMVVASATGITASGTGTNILSQSGGQTWCLVDKELEQVSAINSTTLTVRRGQSGSNPAGHISGAQVVCGGGGGQFNPRTGNVSGVFLAGDNASQPTGSCTRANQQFLPVFAINTVYNDGFMYDCLGGKWVQGTLPDNPDQRSLMLQCNTTIGPVAYTSNVTNTTDINGTEWVSSINVPQSAWVTGVKIMSGGTATTDNILGILRDNKGNLIANSATAGQVLSGAASLQTLAFTAARFLVGPAKYFIGVQGNGTAAGAIYTIPTSSYVDIVANKATGTFGTVTATYTVPTTFTADQGPIGCIYY